MIEISGSVQALQLFNIGGISITNTFVFSLIISIIIITIGILAARKSKIIPRGLQNGAEFLIEGILNFMDTVTLSRAKSEKFFPIVATLFLFILSCNLIELLPGLGAINVRGGELLRTPSSDLTNTIALALITMFTVEISSIKELGFFTYLKKFINFSNPLKFFIGIIELISEASKILSLSLRLFASMFSGEIVLMVVIGLFAYLLPLPIMGFELFIGLIQAFIFSILTTVFLSLMTEKSEHA